MDKSWDISEIKNQNFEYYNSSESFPAENLWVSDRIPGRGIEMVNLQVIPYKYHPQSKQLEVYSEVAVHIIEDGAQSFGAEYYDRKSGNLSNLSCTSFFPAKPLGCYGDGGAILTNNKHFVEKLISVLI